VAPFLQPEFRAAARSRREHLVASMVHRDRADLQVKECCRYQLQHLLQFDDRVSMSQSVESRQPFLDYRLLELVLALPDSMLMHEGWSKWILRAALPDVLPEAIRLRKDKMGFDTPTARLMGDNQAFFASLMLRHRDDPLVDVPAVLDACQRGAVEEALLCAVCSYLTWREQFDVRS
jgi:asparagine synthetase B (glutamine-hydrolysing)